VTFERLAVACSLLLVAAACSSTGRSAGDDAGNAACPATEPTAGTPCSPAGLSCSYGCANVAECNVGTWAVIESNIVCSADGGAGEGDAGHVLPDGAIACASQAECPSSYDCSPGGVITGCGICEMPQNPCSTDASCAGDAASSPPMVCGPAPACTCSPTGMTGVCVAACTSTSGCGPEEACDPTGHCVAKPCTTDSDCPSTQTEDFACSPAGTCAQKTCTTDGDCGGHYCVDGMCYPQQGVCTPPAA
jgi:hypothetical protein